MTLKEEIGFLKSIVQSLTSDKQDLKKMLSIRAKQIDRLRRAVDEVVHAVRDM